MEIWLVEDDSRLRASVSAGLQRLRAALNVRAFGCGRDALMALQDGHAPSVGLVDLGLPDMGGIELIEQMLTCQPGLALIALTVRSDDDAVFGALRKGAIGYLLKDSSPEELVGAIDQTLSGGSALSPSIARRIVRDLQPDSASKSLFRLTGRENQVLEQLCSGASYREAAERLGITEGTVHTHVKRVYEKLGAASKAEAVRIAFDLRLVAPRHG